MATDRHALPLIGNPALKTADPATDLDALAESTDNAIPTTAEITAIASAAAKKFAIALG